ncbi:MAG: hypothetical protein NT012_01535 [Candidatus Nealsonbacteria bacterium]|nr:hypothetical protein [Candidatus Nealsonbacteria bacterium]
MAEKIKKTIPWFLALVLFGIVSVVIFNIGKPTPSEVKADISTTTVTVANSAPTWVAVYENPESSTSTPTNATSTVTFKGQADDPNNESWYLLICKGTGYSTTTGGGCSTCTAGAWGTSTLTTDNATATVTYTTVAGDAENNAWYAYACDNNSTSQMCTSVSQGTGATAPQYSPFVVNHRPSFTAQGNSGPVNPAAVIAFSASSTDTDSYGGNDTLTFTVCKTSGLSGIWCDGGSSDTWCTTTAASNPSCTSTAPDPSEGAQNYYPYIFDNHNFAATGTQGALQTFTVNNVTPQVSNVTLNSGNIINLSVGGEGPNGSTTIYATADVVDHNGCSDFTTGITVKAYPTGIGAGGCTSQNNNTCYYNISCTAGPCQGNGYTATTSCTINFKYHADPTDTGTPRVSETWKDTVTAQDEALSGSNELTTGIELQSYLALDVTSQIQYGTLAQGEISDTTNLPQTATTTATGNTGLDIELSGTKMCTDFENYPNCAGNTITTSSQKYATSSVQYQNATSLATSTAVELELNCQKTIVTASPANKANWWGLQVPLGTQTGSYTGQNTYTAVRAETGDW